MDEASSSLASTATQVGIDMQLYSLDSIEEPVLGKVGGKARGLYRLTQAGLSIEPGFVIYGIQSRADIEQALDYYERSGLNLVAVRSSATGEDGSEYSHAGQYETVLNVQGREPVRKAILRCLSSLGNERASQYEQHFGLPNGENQMSLVIERMAEARVAGVCFTQDPTAAQAQLLLEVVPGLGEGLVSGTKQAEQYHLSKKAGSWSFAEGQNLLSPDELTALAIDAQKAVESLGCELDLEWVIDRQGDLYWLQARPITARDDDHVTIDEFTVKSDIHDLEITTCNVGEMLNGAVTPLTLCTFAKAIDRGMRDMFITAGVFKDKSEVPEGTCVLSVNNTLFLNLTYMHMMSSAIISTDDQTDISLCGRLLPPESRQRSTYPRSKWRRKVNMLHYVRYLLSRKKAIRRITELSGSFAITDSDDPKVLYKSLCESQEVLDKAFAYHYVTSAHSGAMSSALFQILLAQLGSESEAKALVAQGMENIDGIESADILSSLERLKAAVLAKYPRASEWDITKLQETIESDQGEIKDCHDAFMSRHGHRCIREAELRTLSWAYDSVGFYTYLKQLLVTPLKVQDGTKEDPYRCLDCLSGRMKRICTYLLKQSRQAVVNREYTKSKSILITGRIKIGYRRLAKLLCQRGLLPDEDLIFFFTDSEIKGLLDGYNGELIRKAMHRRRLLPLQNELRYPEISLGVPQPIKPEAPSCELKELQGTPISRGAVTGKARVIRTLSDAAQLKNGEIIIASTTDIGWSPFYPLAGGMVTEIGSVLSHGAVVAREYALPFVSNIKGATLVIKTGDTLEVDGSQGVVRILASS